MKKLVLILGLVALAGCAQLQSVGKTVSGVCLQVQAITSNPAAVAVLNAQDPGSAVGVLWADTKAACAGAQVASGVDPDWAGLVFGELKALAPTVLPLLIGLL